MEELIEGFKQFLKYEGIGYYNTLYLACPMQSIPYYLTMGYPPGSLV